MKSNVSVVLTYIGGLRLDNWSLLIDPGDWCARPNAVRRKPIVSMSFCAYLHLSLCLVYFCLICRLTVSYVYDGINRRKGPNLFISNYVTLINLMPSQINRIYALFIENVRTVYGPVVVISQFEERHRGEAVWHKQPMNITTRVVDL